MKLAIISPGFQPVPAVNGGAIEQLITSIVEANDQSHDFDIDLYTVYDEKLSNYNYKYTKIISYRRKWFDFILRAFSFILRKIYFSFHKETSFNYISFHIRNLFKKNYYDIVLVENNMDIYSTILSMIKDEKLYFHLHNDFDNGDLAKTKRKVEKIIKTSDGIITVSKFLKNKLELYGASNVTVVYNFVPQRFSQSIDAIKQRKERKKLNFKDRDVIFTYVGRLDKDKGADKFLMALDKLKDTNEHIKALAVGSTFFHTKAERKHWKKIANLKNKVKRRAKFLGYVHNEELTKVYSVSDCVVIPSQVEEAFGLVALEAMKMKKPVIASNSGALPEILSPEGAIILNKDYDFVNCLYQAINTLSRDPQLRKKMGIANFYKSKKFPSDKEEYFTLIKEAMKI